MESPSLKNFKNLLAYPFKEKKSGSKILIGSLLIFSSAIIPFLPLLIVLGYMMRIAKRIIDGDGELSMPEWNQWGDYLRDGFKWFVALLLYSIPLILIFSIGYFVYFASFISLAAFEDAVNPPVWSIVLPFFGMGVLFFTMFIGILLAIIEFVFLPVGLMHMVHTGKFSSVFNVSQWWPVLKKNFLGFLVAMIFLFGFYYFMMMAFSALYMSVFLCFVIPFAMAPLTFLMGLWTIPLFSQAYREEKPEPIVVPETEVLPGT